MNFLSRKWTEVDGSGHQPSDDYGKNNGSMSLIQVGLEGNDQKLLECECWDVVEKVGPMLLNTFSG